MGRVVDIRLSQRELMYLKNAGFTSVGLNELVNDLQLDDDRSAALLSITREEAEEFRSMFMDRLDSVGFDSNYELTAEGRVLQDLIDLFFARLNSG